MRVQVNPRQGLQQRIDRQQPFTPQFDRQLLEFVQADCIADLERPDPRSPQGTEVRPAAQRGTDVLGQRAHIKALAALDSDRRLTRVPGDRPQAIDPHGSRAALDFDALPGQPVQRLAAALERRMHRRHLLEASSEAGQNRREGRLRHRDRSTVGELALGVPGGRGRSQHEPRLVALVGVQKVRRELGRLPERQRQQPARQRIERAGVAGLARIEQSAGSLQRGVGARTDRLVQQQHPVNGLEPRVSHPGRRVQPDPRRPTASSIRRSISKPRSTEGS